MQKTQVAAAKIKRAMARKGLSFVDLSAKSGIDRRTISSLVKGEMETRDHVVQKVAVALEIDPITIFDEASAFDRATNPELTRLMDEKPKLFRGLTEAEVDELYSRFAVGGAMTEAAILHAVQMINERRELTQKLTVLLETPSADLVRRMIEEFYKRETKSVR